METGEEGADVFLLEPDGEVVERLTADRAYNGSPAFSPDGSRIAFYAENADRSELVIVERNGDQRRFGLPWKAWYPRWSPDGRWLVFTTSGAGGEEDLEVMAMELADAGGAVLTLAGGPGRESEGRWRPRQAGGPGG